MFSSEKRQVAPKVTVGTICIFANDKISRQEIHPGFETDGESHSMSKIGVYIKYKQWQQ